MGLSACRDDEAFHAGVTRPSCCARHTPAPGWPTIQRRSGDPWGVLMSRSIHVRSAARRRAVWAAAATLVLAAVPATTASARPSENACERRNNNTYEKLLECVRLKGVREHQAAFQAAADANGGNRAAGLPGYTASVEYVVDTLREAGWNVELDQFPFTFTPPPTLRQLTPVAATYPTAAFTGTGFGEITAGVVAVDINLVPPRANTSGCDGAFTEAAVGAPLVPHPDWARRLRRLPGGRYRADPARRMQLRPEGVQRPGSRRECDHHLQPGRHPTARSGLLRQCRGAGAGPGPTHDPHRRRVVRRRLDSLAGRIDGARSTSIRPRAGRR